MVLAASDTILPTAALVFPLLVGAALVASGAGAAFVVLRDPERRTVLQRSAVLRARTDLAIALGNARAQRGPVPRILILAALRIVAGVLLLVTAGPAYTTAAMVAVALCAFGLAGALRAFASTSVEPAPSPAAVAAAAALLAFATASTAQGILGFTGIPAQLMRLDQRDLNWAAALVGVLAACTLLQLARRNSAPEQDARRHG
ncbi:hypothetical protein [Rathayibacter iranicus]|uniref:Uncharacterized protein n=2 Tax=Rathayibacter iranicus TaxID=59737 RepID=A0AAD1AE43_9MICO|nr:hypothetical protein [Rathayibacter iranicus]AZZ56509.1 hypothetical protein C7V51_11950 [Rathayibacter iranicus]MWV31949.1 hypothetical protein [Rathayibacter iranicus NCPPB 2253 = VKM Ac-1602]PPI43778.1 hypothetical protein C5E09_10875 [Rathayibacter iranicus]PPI58895.1 hypothetical protein C5E08_11790 [Rathayibacter iranicus]PPI69995.1 hypothetical protein C5E01_10840 [Rathayibacter iranicus]